MLFRTLVLKSSSLPATKRAVTGSSAFRGLVERFIAGETLDQALSVAERLADEGFGVSLDHLGENVSSLEEAAAGTSDYLELLARIGASRQAGKVNISVKLTALGLDQAEADATANYRRLLERAKPHGTFVRVDMEASPYTEATIKIVEDARAEFTETGTVLQSYLHRTDDDINRLMKIGCRLRLVKGAYLEPAEVAIKDKAEVDAKYVLQAKRLLTRANYPALATHDEAIISEISDFVEAERIDPRLFEWQMLYGIRRDLQEALLAKGHNVRVYVPYGKAWYPYFSRRLAERPANLLFIAKSLMRK